MNNIGKIIYGFCNGFFGRDDYNNKIIVYETEKAICCRYIDYEDKDLLTTCNFKSEEEKNNYIKEWEQKDKYN